MFAGVCGHVRRLPSEHIGGEAVPCFQAGLSDGDGRVPAESALQARGSGAACLRQ